MGQATQKRLNADEARALVMRDAVDSPKNVEAACEAALDIIYAAIEVEAKQGHTVVHFAWKPGSVQAKFPSLPFEPFYVKADYGSQNQATAWGEYLLKDIKGRGFRAIWMPGVLTIKW